MFKFRRKTPKKQQMKVELNEALKQAIILCKLKAQIKRHKRSQR